MLAEEKEKVPVLRPSQYSDKLIIKCHGSTKEGVFAFGRRGSSEDVMIATYCCSIYCGPGTSHILTQFSNLC